MGLLDYVRQAVTPPAPVQSLQQQDSQSPGDDLDRIAALARQQRGPVRDPGGDIDLREPSDTAGTAGTADAGDDLDRIAALARESSPAQPFRAEAPPVEPTRVVPPAADNTPGPYAHEVERMFADRGVPMPSVQPPKAAPDVTRTASPLDHDAGMSVARAAGISNDASLAARVTNALGDAAAHPVKTAAGLAWSPIQAAMTLDKAASESDARNAIAASGGDPSSVPQTVSAKDASFAAAQLGTLALGPEFDALLAKAAKPFVGAIGNALGETAADVAGRAAQVGIRGATGAAAGAVFNPSDPAVGAVLGGAAGAAHAAATGARVEPGRVALDESSANLAQHPDRLLGDPNKIEPMATTTVAPESGAAPAGEDFSVETNSVPDALDELAAKARASGEATAPANVAPLEKTEPSLPPQGAVDVENPSTTAAAPLSPLEQLRKAVSTVQATKSIVDQTRSEGERRGLERAAHTDALTGLGNQRAFDAALSTAEADPATSVVRFDVNGMKGINDALGHEAGNDALRSIAAAIHQHAAGLPSFRVGGDEFAVLAPVDRAEQLRQAVEHAVGVQLVHDPVKTIDNLSRGQPASVGKYSISGGVGATNAAADADAYARKAQHKAEQGIGPRLPEPSAGVRTVPLSELDVEPHRFQYKLNTNEKGVGRELENVKAYNPDLAGVISVWRDPADGRLKVINGHHRVDLAFRHGVKSVDVREIQAPSAAAARATGAMINVAEGRGTAVDAAKLFRDTQATPADLERRGVSLAAPVARDGLALAKLAPTLFSDVVAGKMPVQRAAVIGSADLAPEQQVALVKMLDQREASGQRMTNEALGELIRFVKSAGTEETTQETTQESLFGAEHMTQSLAPEKAELSAYIKERLGKDRRIFGFIAKGDRAARVEAAGAGKIETDRASDIAARAAQAEEVYHKLSSMSGPVSDALTEAARALARGGNRDAIRTALYDAASAHVADVIGQLDTGAGAAGLHPTADGRREGQRGVGAETIPGRSPAADRGAGPEEVTGAEAGNTALPFHDENQGGLAIGEPIQAYHGSPHHFDRFSLEQVGSGEGAQAYGWGLYFASRKDVAEWYRRKLASHGGAYHASAEKDGRSVRGEDLLAEYFKPGTIIPGYGGHDRVLAFHRGEPGAPYPRYEWSVDVQRVNAEGQPAYGEHPRRHTTAPDMSELKQVLAPQGWKIRAGNLYHVELPDSETFLDWDRPLRAQPARVRRALGVRFMLGNRSKTGGEFYRELASQLSREADGGNDGMAWGRNRPNMEAASKLLLGRGINGIQYSDGASRSGTGDTHNYVVFDDKTISIRSIAERAKQRYDPEQLDALRVHFDGHTHTLADLESEDATASTAAKREIARILTKQIDELGARTPRERAADVEAANSTALVDPVGLIMRSSADRVRLMTAFRHPAMEILHAFAVDDGGRIVAHNMVSAGAINTAPIQPDWFERVARLAEDSGASSVYLAHNHPSGDPAPSSDDIAVQAHFEYYLARRPGPRMASGGHIIIDHDTASHVTFEGNDVQVATVPVAPGGYGVTKQPYRTGIEAGAPTVTNPHQAVDYYAATLFPGAVTVLYLDAQHRVIGIGPRLARDLATIDQWLGTAAEAQGATAVLIATDETDARELARRVGATRERSGGGNQGPVDAADSWTHPILDIIGIEYNDAGVPLKSTSHSDEAGSSVRDRPASHVIDEGIELRHGTPAIDQLRRARAARDRDGKGPTPPGGRGSPAAGETGRLPARHGIAGVAERDLFGNDDESDLQQGSLFSSRDGTAASRSLRETERAARSELETLRAKEQGTTSAVERLKLARRIAELERLVNRDNAISADELRTRAAADQTEPGQRTLNPFRAKADVARRRADESNRPTGHDAGMAEYFPLGAGFGRPGSARRVDRSVTKAVEAVEAEKHALHLEAQADAFDRGEINAQGQAISPESMARSERRETGAVHRAARIAAAKQTARGKSAWEVPAATWADASGNLGGGARKLLLFDHRAAVERAVAEGRPVPRAVLADYPDLAGGAVREPLAPYANAAPSATPGASHPMPEPSGLGFRQRAFRPLELIDKVRAVLNPESLGPEARATAGTVRHEAAKRFRAYAQAEHALRDLRQYVEKQPRATQAKWWDDYENGRATGDALVDRMNRVFAAATEERTAELIKLDRLKAERAIENYVGRFWSVDRAGAKAQNFLRTIFGRRPLEGPKSFLKQRDLEHFVDGLDAGLVPATYNYVESQLAKIQEMERLIGAEHMLRAEQKAGRAKPVMLGHEPPRDVDGNPWKRIDRDGNDAAFTIWAPPTVSHFETVDAIVHGKLAQLIQQLGVTHEKPIRMRAGVLGDALDDVRIRTRFGGAEGTIMHELGHILDARYGLRHAIETGIGAAPMRTVQKGKRAGKQVPDYAKEGPEARKRRQRLRDELRNLANLREESLGPSGTTHAPDTKDLSKSARAYLHSWPEKMANIVNAYIAAPDRFKQVAPGIYEFLDQTIEQHPELHALRDIKPSLAHEGHGVTERLPGPVLAGHWYAPASSAAIWQAHLSRGLRGNPIYDALTAPGMAATQLLLGFSGFHGTTIATEGMFSELVMAADKLATGHALGAANAAVRAVTSPVAGVAFGRRVMREYRQPGSHPELASVIEAMVAGGFRGQAKSELWSGERADALKRAVRQAIHGDTKLKQAWGASKVPFDAIYAGIELASAPLLSKYVPLMKTAATYHAVAQRLAELPADVDGERLEREMADVVKEMDYRFGQVQYDNHFINNVAKHLAQAMFLAPGWTFGTLALMGRGARDVATIPVRGYQRARGSAEPASEFVGRSGKYWIAAVIGTMLINALLTYLATGTAPGSEDPDGWKDFFAFRDGTYDADGNANRHTIPGYLMHDVYGWSHHPYDTFINKLSPFWAFAGRVMRNQDFFGNMIRDPDASLPTQGRQVGRAAAKEFAPLSVQNYLEGDQRESKPLTELLRDAIGVTPAKREFQRDAAQNRMAELARRHGHDQATPDEAQARADRASALAGLRGGGDAATKITRAVERGELTMPQLEQMLRRAGMTSLQERYKALTLSEALDVFNRAAPWERARFADILNSKIARAAAAQK